MARFQSRLRSETTPLPVDQWSPAFLASLPALMPSLLDLDLAPATRASYNGHVRQYLTFCDRTDRPHRPDATVLAQFILGRAMTGYKLSTIELGVYAVAKWGKEQFGITELLETPVVQRALKAAPRIVTGPQAPEQKLPLSWSVLRSILTSVMPADAASPFIKARDAALLIVGWQGMFRSSELVNITWEHVHFTDKGVMIYVPSSKTDPSDGSWVFLGDSGATVGASFLLRRLRTFLGGFPTGPVFTGWQHTMTAMSKTTVSVRVKCWLSRANVPAPDLYAAHSLRRGGATHAARLGIPLRYIMTMGRWKSDAVRQYLYNSPTDLFTQSSHMLTTVQA